MLRPFYVHTPTSYVYETPYATNIPVGLYSLANGMVNLYNGNQYYSNGYRSMSVETPYSAAALAVQGNRYPPTTMSVPNEIAYPVIPWYNAIEYTSAPYAVRYGVYGQRGSLSGSVYWDWYKCWLRACLWFESALRAFCLVGICTQWVLLQRSSIRIKNGSSSDKPV